MARLMAYSLLTEEDRLIREGSTDEVIEVADLLPTDWPGIIVHVEGARLRHWGEPDA